MALERTIDERFREMLIHACNRPAMYVDRSSLMRLSILFTAYCLCAQDFGKEIRFSSFRRWVEAKFCIFSPAWNWVRILLHEYGDDQSAIAKLPELYDEFLAETTTMTSDELWQLVQKRMMEVRGTTYWCPDEKETWTRLPL